MTFPTPWLKIKPMNDLTQGFIGFIIAMNIIGFILIAVDKKRVGVRDKARINEVAMLLVAGFFGAIGTLFAMLIFRHKWYKWYFKVFVPILAVVNVLLAIVIIYFLYEAGIGGTTSVDFGFWFTN